MSLRLRTFKRGPYTLWADRVPALYGNQNLFHLFRDKTPELGSERVYVGNITGLRRALESAA